MGTSHSAGLVASSGSAPGVSPTSSFACCANTPVSTCSLFSASSAAFDFAGPLAGRPLLTPLVPAAATSASQSSPASA